MRLSALFEEFCHFLRVEKEAAPRTIETYRWCFKDYESFVMKQIGGTVLVANFTTETCRAYQYDLAARALQTSSIRVRLATLGSFGKWAVRRDKVARNPVDALTRPRRKARLPRVPRWDTVERLLEQCTDWRERALLALMCYGGLRRSEIVALDVGDVAPGLGLRRVQGKGGAEVAVPLPPVAQKILGDYLAMVRMEAMAAEPLFVSRFKTKGWARGRGSDEKSPCLESHQSDRRARRYAGTPPSCLPSLLWRGVAPPQQREPPCRAGASPACGHSDDDCLYETYAVGLAEGS
jgi:integrase/recombinase XerC